MEVSNPLLQHETVKDMFKPRLTSAGEVALGQILQGANEPGHDDHVSHGTAFGLVTKDWEGKRRAGSGFCELSFSLLVVSECGHADT